MHSLVRTHRLVVNFAEDRFRPGHPSPSTDEALRQQFKDVVRGPDPALMFDELLARGRDEEVARDLLTEFQLGDEAIEALITYNEQRKRTLLPFTPGKVASGLTALLGVIALLLSKDALSVLGAEEVYGWIQLAILGLAILLVILAPIWFSTSATWREYVRLDVSGQLLEIVKCLPPAEPPNREGAIPEKG